MPNRLPTGSPRLLRRLNSAAVLRAIRAHGPISRADLARATGLSKPGTVDAASIVFVGVLVLRFIALFGSFSVWKFWTLLVLGALELLVVWPAVHAQARKLDVEKLLSAWYLMLILVPGLISFFRAIWLLLPQSVPLGGKQKPLPRRAAKETSSDRKRVR